MRNVIKALFISGFLTLSVPLMAQVHLDIHIGPPAAPQEVIITRPYPEAIWVPGYYVYDVPQRRYVWVAGTWQRPPRAGVVWSAPRYVLHGNHYDYYEGHWGNPGKHKGWEKHEERGEHGHGRGHDD